MYQIFKGMGHSRVYASSDDADITLLASQCDDGDLAVLLVNRTVENKQLPLEVKGSENPGYLKAVLQNTYSEDDLICGELDL